MSLPSRLRAPVAAALAGALVTGLFVVLGLGGPAVADTTKAPPTKAQMLSKADGLTQSRAVFPRSSYLCYGYQDCNKKGYSPAGYGAANDKMYWRMYSGHNCTNYAAYRMVKSGLPNVRPWSGGGNATYWGTKMAKITSATPSIGAVAWWKANTGPAGSAGHVAYVERVVSSTQIIVSQDSWGGDFSWATITKSSGNWPSGFVHFNDVTLSNTAAPTISGYVKVGGVLQATAGTWKPTDAKIAYQWFADGAAIAGATTSSYTPTAAVLGKALTVRTTASKLGYPTKAVTSAKTAAVLPGALSAKVAPALSGTVRVDNVLSLGRGAWNVAPSAYSYRWYAGGVAIPGAASRSLPLSPDLAGKVVTATVTVSRPGYTSVTARTSPSAPVALGLVRATRTPTVTGGTQPLQTLTVEPGAYTPAGAIVTTQWFAGLQPIAGATGTQYVVRSANLTRRIAVRVTVARPGYQTTSFLTTPTGRVRATPTIHVVRKRLRHGVRLRFAVTAPGVRAVTGAPVSGNVVVTAGHGFRQVIALRNAHGTVVVTGLPAGLRNVTLTYRGSRAALPARRVTTVRLR